MAMPLIIFGGLFLTQIIRNWNGINDIDMSTLNTIYQESMILFMSIDGGALGSIVGALAYFLNMLGFVDYGPYILVIGQIVYMVVVELLWLIYDLIIFIPRACRSIVERGM